MRLQAKLTLQTSISSGIAQVQAVKPAPEIYRLALSKMGVDPQNALAIEDTSESAAAALAAGVPTLALAGVEAERRDFPLEVMRVDRLESEWLRGRSAA